LGELGEGKAVRAQSQVGQIADIDHDCVVVLTLSSQQ
jgi:hypothetical protein